jgi:integrase
LAEYLKSSDFGFDDYLFPSRKKSSGGGVKPLSVRAFRGKLARTARELGIKEKIGTHSMRKTGAYMMVKGNEENAYIVAQISKLLNHSDQSVTFRYLGIEQEDLDALCANNKI